MPTGLINAGCVKVLTMALLIPNAKSTNGPMQQSDAAMAPVTAAPNALIVHIGFFMVVLQRFQCSKKRTEVFRLLLFAGVQQLS